MNHTGVKVYEEQTNCELSHLNLRFLQESHGSLIELSWLVTVKHLYFLTRG